MDRIPLCNQSSDQDSSLEDEKAKKEDRPSFSHLSTHSVTMQTKKNLAMTSLSREKYTTTASGKIIKTPSTGSIKPVHRTKDYSSGKPDPIIIAYSSVPADCTYNVISQNREIKSGWQSQSEKRTNVPQQTTQNYQASGN